MPTYSTPIKYAQLDTGKKYEFNITTLKQNSTYILDVGSLPNTSSEIAISSSTAESLGFKNHKGILNQKLNLTFISGENTEVVKSLNIVGVLQKSFLFNDNLVTNSFQSSVNEEVNASNPSLRDEYSFIFFILNKNISTEKTEEVKIKLNNMDFAAQTYAESVKDNLNQIDIIIYGLYIFASIVLLASSFGVINTLLMSVLERTKEIGLMRSVGMSQRGIFAIFSIEAVSLGFWGSLLGTLVVTILSPLINSIASQNFLKGFDGFNLLIMSPLSTFGIIMIITFVAGVFPSIKASKQNPIAALRSE